MSFQLDHEAFDDACDDYCLYAPPPLCHQRSIEFPGSSYSFQDEVVDTELVYRSISLAGTQAVLDDYCTDATSALIDGSYDYSSPHTNDSCLWESELPLAYDRSLSISDSLCSSDAGYASYCTAAHLYMHPVQSQNAPSKVTELPPELFDLVLQHLSTSPGRSRRLRFQRAHAEDGSGSLTDSEHLSLLRRDRAACGLQPFFGRAHSAIHGFAAMYAWDLTPKPRSPLVCVSAMLRHEYSGKLSLMHL
mmetsp:Transcript_25402/g.55522  ORF Transcript_25402/g.55522 Transcript_25402/m.55522 type:complete len:248 (+) Transcript_25402:217-960(+)|eukprot:910358-Pleurochrysis_carterae.AAC.7